jgi:hypothetical protein
VAARPPGVGALNPGGVTAISPGSSDWRRSDKPSAGSPQGSAGGRWQSASEHPGFPPKKRTLHPSRPLAASPFSLVTSFVPRSRDCGMHLVTHLRAKLHFAWRGRPREDSLICGPATAGCTSRGGRPPIAERCPLVAGAFRPRSFPPSPSSRSDVCPPLFPLVPKVSAALWERRPLGATPLLWRRPHLR